MSVANCVEVSLVIEDQRGPEGMRQAESFFSRGGVTFEPVTIEHGALARQALPRFRRGRH